MKRATLLGILSAVSLIGLLFAQSPLTDVSAPDNPFPLNETKTLNDFVGKNVADKEILAYIVRVDQNMTFQWDFYFKPEGVKPGEVAHIADLTRTLSYTRGQIYNPATGEVSEIPPRPIKSLEGKVLYVQFIDGSQWGDRKLGEHVLKNREAIYNLLLGARAAYNAEGKDGLTNFLKERGEGKQEGPPDRDLRGGQSEAVNLLHLQAQAGTDAALERIDSRIESKERHDRTMASMQ
jgi:hypothetical protein